VLAIRHGKDMRLLSRRGNDLLALLPPRSPLIYASCPILCSTVSWWYSMRKASRYSSG
jgi:hypothetical protein